MATTLKVGDKAPNFTLPNTDLKPVSLKDFVGQKVVLAFLLAPSLQSAQKKCALFVILCLD